MARDRSYWLEVDFHERIKVNALYIIIMFHFTLATENTEIRLINHVFFIISYRMAKCELISVLCLCLVIKTTSAWMVDKRVGRYIF